MATKQAKPRGKAKVVARKAVKKAAVKRVKVAPKPVAKTAPPVVTQGRPTAASKLLRMKLFVKEYLKHNFNGRQAAIAVGYSPGGARDIANDLLALPQVQAMLQAETAARCRRLDIETDEVLQRMHAIATADPRELIELHRCCCRFCYGNEHHYQWTPNEMRQAVKDHEQAVIDAAGDKAALAKVKAPDLLGGTGFNPYSDPNPKCPECFGEGAERVVPKDTRDLSPGAQLLYAGVKTTQNGLEIKMHDQTGMLVNVGRHLGMFEKKVKHSGSIGVHQTLGDLLDDIDGAGTGLPDHASRAR